MGGVKIESALCQGQNILIGDSRAEANTQPEHYDTHAMVRTQGQFTFSHLPTLGPLNVISLPKKLKSPSLSAQVWGSSWWTDPAVLRH